MSIPDPAGAWFLPRTICCRCGVPCVARFTISTLIEFRTTPEVEQKYLVCQRCLNDFQKWINDQGIAS